MTLERLLVVSIFIILLAVSGLLDNLLKKKRDLPIWSIRAEKCWKILAFSVSFVLIIGLICLKLSQGYVFHNCSLIFFTIFMTLIICCCKFSDMFILLTFSSPYLQIVTHNQIEIAGKIKQYKKEMNSLDGRFDLLKLKWVIQYNSEEQLAKCFDSLRNLGFMFEGGVNTDQPSRIFEALRKKGLLQGEFTEITWTYSGESTLVVK